MSIPPRNYLADMAYLRNINSNQGYNSFPSQTGQTDANGSPIGSMNGQPQPQPQQQKPNAFQQGINAAGQGYMTYQMGNGIANQFATQAPAQASTISSAGAPAASAAAQGGQSGWALGSDAANTANTIGSLYDGAAPAGEAVATEGTPLWDYSGPSYAGYAAAAYDAYRGYNNFRKADPDMQGTKFQQAIALPVADVFTGGLAGLAEGIGRSNPTTRHWLEEIDKLDSRTNPFSILWKKFGSSKDADQLRRDSYRHNLKDQGFLNGDYQLQLAKSGQMLDLGKDGGFKYTNSLGQERPVYNVDWENDPNAQQAIGWLNPVAHIISNGDEKGAADMAAQIYNELTENGKVTDINEIRNRVLDFYHTLQLKPSLVRDAINSMGLDQGKKDAMYAAIDNLRPGAPKTQDLSIKSPTQKTEDKPVVRDEKPDLKPPAGTGGLKATQFHGIQNKPIGVGNGR